MEDEPVRFRARVEVRERVDRRLLREEQAERESQCLLHRLDEERLPEARVAEPAPFDRRLVALVHADRRPPGAPEPSHPPVPPYALRLPALVVETLARELDSAHRCCGDRLVGERIPAGDLTELALQRRIVEHDGAEADERVGVLFHSWDCAACSFAA